MAKYVLHVSPRLVLVLLALGRADLVGTTVCQKVKFGADSYDLSPLSKPTLDASLETNWNATESGRVDEQNDYVFFLNVCGGLSSPNNVWANQACLQVSPDQTSMANNCGNISTAQLVQIRDGDLRFKIGGGRACNAKDEFNNTIYRSAEVILVCSENTAVGKPLYVDEYSTSTCAACPLGSSYRTHCGEQSAALPSGSTVVLVLFGVTVAFYLLVGFVYMRFIKGARGIEQFPNVHFWLDLCELVGLGCAFSLRCGRTHSSYSIAAEPVVYKMDPTPTDQLVGGTLGDHDSDNEN